MRSFKKVNIGLLVALALIVSIAIYVVIATAVNYADKESITDVANRFATALAKADKEYSDPKYADEGSERVLELYDSFLKDFYIDNADSSAALTRFLKQDQWNSIDFTLTDSFVTFKGFSNASASVDFYDSSYDRVTSFSFEMIKVNGVWKIGRWSVGNRNYPIFF